MSLWKCYIYIRCAWLIFVPHCPPLLVFHHSRWSPCSPQAFRLACACMLVHTDTSLNSYSTYEIKCTILSRLSLLPCHPPLFRLLPPPPHSLHSTFLPYIFKSRIYKSREKTWCWPFRQVKLVSLHICMRVR